MILQSEVQSNQNRRMIEKCFSIFVLMLLDCCFEGRIAYNFTGTCHSVDIMQVVTVNDPTCGPRFQYHMPNKQCLGTCPIVFGLNVPVTQAGQGISNACKMCKPVLLYSTIGIKCRTGAKKYHFRKLTQVTDCKCEVIDCKCPSR